ncbi:dihydrofolate reductase family protein [Curtobacterium sp. MCJR17_043]|uniref:RibD family protein n=1 Tax=Curtobacterium sp. MCJR17_043 TaxID=2175660 RepID=UPI0032E8B944
MLVEGGPTVASAFIAAGLADELLVYLAPVLLGGPRVALDDIGVGSIQGARMLRVLSTSSLGPDLLVRARPVPPAVRSRGRRGPPPTGAPHDRRTDLRHPPGARSSSRSPRRSRPRTARSRCVPTGTS